MKYIYTLKHNFYFNIILQLYLFLWRKADILAGITPVFSATLIFRNHSNMLIWCSRNIYNLHQCWKLFCCLIFMCKKNISPRLMKRKLKINIYLYLFILHLFIWNRSLLYIINAFSVILDNINEYKSHLEKLWKVFFWKSFKNIWPVVYNNNRFKQQYTTLLWLHCYIV